MPNIKVSRRGIAVLPLLFLTAMTMITAGMTTSSGWEKVLDGFIAYWAVWVAVRIMLHQPRT